MVRNLTESRQPGAEHNSNDALSANQVSRIGKERTLVFKTSKSIQLATDY